LPGGGFAVGRFSGDREFPVVFTEMDGGFNNGATPRMIRLTSRGSRARGGFARVFRNMFSFLGRRRSLSISSSSTFSSYSSSSESVAPATTSGSNSMFSRYFRRIRNRQSRA
jgi:E3 ubiquitin-protein ligase RNF115/126